MAHQCLKCGRSYPDGSPQILKGCEDCQGTRFFYTEQPIGERERERLQARTEDELGSAGQELPRRERRIPTKGELPVGEERDWVSLGPGNLRNIVEDVVRRAHEKKPTFRVASGQREPPSLEEWVRQRQKDMEPEGNAPVDGRPVDRPPGDRERTTTQEDDQEVAWPPWPDAPRRREQGPTVQGEDRAASEAEEGSGGPTEEEPADVVYRRRREAGAPLEPGSEAEPEAAPDPGLHAGPESSAPLHASRGQDGHEEQGLPVGDAPDEGAAVDEPSSSLHQGRPETVEVLEQGVYDLDVERLLEKNPIVVHKDGSYSLHLPSLMETLEKKRR